MSEPYVEPGRAFGAADVFAAVVSPVAKVTRFFKREAAIARSQHHLESLNDDVLKDIGMHRTEIFVATRQRRGEHGRRYL